MVQKHNNVHADIKVPLPHVHSLNINCNYLSYSQLLNGTNTDQLDVYKLSIRRQHKLGSVMNTKLCQNFKLTM